MAKSKMSFLIAAAAAYGAYKYSKMTPEQKNSLMAKGKDFLNKNFNGLNSFLPKKETTPSDHSPNTGF